MHSVVWTDCRLWTWCLTSSVWTNIEVIPPSFYRSFDPFHRLRSLLTEVPNSSLLDFWKVCFDPSEIAQATFLCSVFGCLWLCPPSVWFLDPRASVVSLCLQCDVLPWAASWIGTSLSCFLMLLWNRQPRSIWRCGPLFLLSRTSNDCCCFWWTPVSVGYLPNPYTSSNQPFSKRKWIYLVDIPTCLHMIHVIQATVAVPDRLLPRMVIAGKRSWHQTVSSFGLASLIVEIES